MVRDQWSRLAPGRTGVKLVGEALIRAERELVWQAINDPGILRQCIPGCEEITRETPVDWVATVVTRVGQVKARFTGRIRLEDLEAPESCRIVGEGSGGAAGFAKGSALVRLAQEAEGTRLTYDVGSEIGGKLAQIGSRLIEAFAKKYAAEFFDKFAAIVEAGTASDISAISGEAPVIPILPGDAPAPAVAGAYAMPAAGAQPRPAPAVAESTRRWFDAQSFTILVLAALLVFMTVMYTLK